MDQEILELGQSLFQGSVGALRDAFQPMETTGTAKFHKLWCVCASVWYCNP